jgi:GAF domain-containing protein
MLSFLPGDEVARTKVLSNYRILDTPPEECYDDLVRVATYICGTPIGSISIIDAEREWFKSKIGWNVGEIPRETSFGTHTVTQPDVLVVSDTLKDIRFAKNQLATQAGVRFYAGAPLLTPDGYALGTLSVMDHVPRALTEEQTSMLGALAVQVMTHLEGHGRL